VSRVVEIDEVARAHIDCADAEARFTGVDAVEVDKPFERAFELSVVVVARRFESIGRLQPWDEQARREKAQRATQQGETGADLVRQSTREVASRRRA
jgi:hypothetical protein